MQAGGDRTRRLRCGGAAWVQSNPAAAESVRPELQADFGGGGRYHRHGAPLRTRPPLRINRLDQLLRGAKGGSCREEGARARRLRRGIAYGNPPEDAACLGCRSPSGTRKAGSESSTTERRIAPVSLRTIAARIGF